MQTFLPYPNFIQSAKCLDYKRLGKQRVEAMQLVNVLNRGHGPWSNHPAALMWKSYEDALKLYHNIVVQEWINRGYKNNMKFYNVEFCVMPPWLGDEAFHASHRSNLLRKNSEFYGQYCWTEPTDLPYIWPTKNNCLQLARL